VLLNLLPPPPFASRPVLVSDLPGTGVKRLRTGSLTHAMEAKYLPVPVQNRFLAMALIGIGPVIGAVIPSCVQDSGVLKSPNAQVPALPVGFPAKLNAKLAWTGADFPHEWSYICELSEIDLAEVNGGLNHFKCESWPCRSATLSVMERLTRRRHSAGTGRGPCEPREFPPSAPWLQA
jgi:hypothetical protein